MLAVLEGTWEWHLTRAILALIHSDTAKSGSREVFFLWCFQSYKFQHLCALYPSCVPHRNWKNALPHPGYHVQLLCAFPRMPVTQYTMPNGSQQGNFLLWWFWRLKVWNPCVGSHDPLKGSREEPFLSSSSLWWLLVTLDTLWLIDASLPSLLPPLLGLFLFVVVSLSKFPSFDKEAVMLGSRLALICWPHFNWTASSRILFMFLVEQRSVGGWWFQKHLGAKGCQRNGGRKVFQQNSHVPALEYDLHDEDTHWDSE